MSEIHTLARPRRSRGEQAGITVRRQPSRMVCVVPQPRRRRFAGFVPITPELRREKIARGLASQLKRLRRDLGFAVSERIRLGIDAPAEVLEATSGYDRWIANELLARE